MTEKEKQRLIGVHCEYYVWVHELERSGFAGIDMEGDLVDLRPTPAPYRCPARKGIKAGTICFVYKTLDFEPIKPIWEPTPKSKKDAA